MRILTKLKDDWINASLLLKTTCGIALFCIITISFANLADKDTFTHDFLVNLSAGLYEAVFILFGVNYIQKEQEEKN